MPGLPGVGHGELEGLEPGLESTTLERQLRVRGIPDIECDVVGGGLEDRDGFVKESGQVLGRAPRFEVHPEHAALDPRAEFTHTITIRNGTLGERIRPL